MAHFFDPLSGEAISNFKIPSTGTFTIGLFGGGPDGPKPNGSFGDGRLDVTSLYVEGWTDPITGFNPFSSDGALIRDHYIGSNQRLLTFRVGKLRSSQLYALYYGSPYASPVTLERVDVRKSIVNLARSFAKADYNGRKAHYLWGTAGNRPGRSDGNPGGGKAASAVLRPPSLQLDAASAPNIARDPDVALGVRMATTSLGGHNTCAGRSHFYSPGDLKSYLGAANEIVTRRGGMQSVAPTDWPGYGPSRLHPRIYYFNGDKQEKGNVVWGESCDGVPHFDCVGLVNYCYAFHYQHPRYSTFAGEIRQWASGLGTQIKDPQDVLNADVVIKADMGHIAMVYLEGGKAKIVQAKGTAYGLTEDDDYVVSDWGMRVRISDQYFVVKKPHL